MGSRVGRQRARRGFVDRPGRCRPADGGAQRVQQNQQAPSAGVHRARIGEHVKLFGVFSSAMTAASPAAVTAPANPSCAHWSTAPAAARSTETIVPGTSTPPIDATTNSTPRHNAARGRWRRPPAIPRQRRRPQSRSPLRSRAGSGTGSRRSCRELRSTRRPRERPQPAPRLRRQPANSRANQLLRPRHAW